MNRFKLKKKKKLIPLSDAIESLFTKKSSPFLEIYFLFQLKKSWKELAGEEISQKAEPLYFRKQTLFLKLPDSTHIQEMHFVKETLKDKINQKFSDYKVQKIFFKI